MVSLSTRATRPRTRRRQRERAERHAGIGQPKARTSLILALSLVLVAGTLVLYSPVRTHEFINYDDKEYVVDNSHVTAGLTGDTVRWSMSSTEQANWHPLTWLSHALDCQLFGLDAGDHHLISLLIHVLNVVLLFLLLNEATGALARSFLVAALFAWHPFNVQSVAWVAERKNLLSTLFFLLTLGAYAWYAQKPQWRRLAAVVAVFVLALASKPMAVTLPFVLLLLDYWPLQRIAGWTSESTRLRIPQQSRSRLLLEKLPLFGISAVSCVLTVWAQRTGGALRSLQAFTLNTRIENAVQSYVIYILRMLWPFGFSLYYPFSEASIPLWRAALAVSFLLTASVLLWRHRRVSPYCLVGWLWFLGTLVPVIGIVQVGDQAMADRYAYLPLIGLFTVLVWAVFDFFDLHRVGSVRWAVAGVVLVSIYFLTFQQLGYWQNSATIWSHAFEVTNGNLVVEKQLANALVMSRDTEKALPHLINIASRDPNDITTHANLGACYASQGMIPEAAQEFEQVIHLTNHKELGSDDRKYRTSAFLNLGFAYVRSKDYPKALTSFWEASEFDPSMVDQLIADFERSLSAEVSESTYLKLSLLLQARGKDSQATSVLQQGIKANPDYVDSRDLLNYLGTQPRVSEHLLGAGAVPQNPS
jgi:tetratricopeptide (TPR) repeat protein